MNVHDSITPVISHYHSMAWPGLAWTAPTAKYEAECETIEYYSTVDGRTTV